MNKEHKTLTAFFTFLANKQDHLQLQAEDAENAIQDFFKFRTKQAEIAKEEKRLNGLKRLELIKKKKEEQQLNIKIAQKKKRLKGVKKIEQINNKELEELQKQQAHTAREQMKLLNKNTIKIKRQASPKSMKEMQALIDRIRN